MKIQKISPFLWYNNQAQEAAQLYTSIFKNSKILSTNPMSTTFELEGIEFIALNGGPHYQFTEATSFFIRCEDQAEVDYYWEKLSEGGSAGRCGWLKDKFGLSWQVIPTALALFLSDPDRVKSKRALDAMLRMNKLDIAALKAAFEG